MSNDKRKINIWFPSLIFENILDNFKDHTDHLLAKAYDIKNRKSKPATVWSCDTYNTLFQYDAFSNADPIIQSLIQTSKEQVLYFSKEYGMTKTIDDIECIDFWFNIAEPGAYQEYHLHPKSHFSVVYYIKTQEKCGNIVFQPADALTDMFPLDVSQPTYASYKNCFYTPTNAMLLIFRSTLLHMVEKNLSGEDRVSIAMNFKFKEN